MKRAIIVVIDSMGIGAMPDAPKYGDVMECNTLRNVARANNGLNIPNLRQLGLCNLCEVKNNPPIDDYKGQIAIMQEKSKGKDTTTGHWEIAGLVLDEPFKTYPNGFPQELIDEFIKQTGCKGVLANYPASGTKVIEDLHEQHEQTKFPIVYTSADSVFQIAVDINVIPLETLYKWCETARKILDNGYAVSRVIARPYELINGQPKRISKYRRDYSVEPPKPTMLNNILEKGGQVIGIGKIEDIFVKSGISHAIHTGSNTEGLNLTLQAIKNELNLDEIKIKNTNNANVSLIFTNLVDTDMLYGHRNDAVGYGKAIEEIDTYIPEFIKNMSDDDLLIITADHGCDPTVQGTDHTREQVPLICYAKNMSPKNLGILPDFTYVSRIVKDWLF